MNLNVTKNSFNTLKTLEDEKIINNNELFFEPEGFYRMGKKDSWRKELNFYQKRKIWMITKEYMTILGYKKSGLALTSTLHN